MENRSPSFEEFDQAFQVVDDDHSLALLDLSTGELSEIETGIAALPDPVGAACRMVLKDWHQLDARGRVAALLVFANALAAISDPEDLP